MSIARNKMVPVLGVVALAIVIVIIVFRWKGGSAPETKTATQAQAELPPTKGADRDTPAESLSTVVASNRELRTQIQQVIADNKRLQDQLAKQRTQSPVAVPSAAVPTNVPPSTPLKNGGNGGITDAFGRTLDNVTQVLDTVSAVPGYGTSRAPGTGAQNAPRGPHSGDSVNAAAGQDASYQMVAPMGYAAVTTGGKGKPETLSYVRTSAPADAGAVDAQGAGARAAAQATQAASTAAKAKPVPYFTLPENSTLVGAVSMTSLIGRVPVDGRVTDPMQFKAVIGRDNLAANGFDLPDDIAGMIVTGIAVGDMTLSCSEGKVYSATFVFNDGSVRTVSARHRGAVQTDQSSQSYGLGYISDMHGNPCIQGKFVTNAPAFLTDLTAMKTLTAAGQAYAAAQQTISQSALTGTTSAVTGNLGSYALGQAVSAGSDEVSKWLLQRMKNSFDAVVTPSGQQLVVHLDREIDIDKDPNGRKLVHRSQAPLIQTGERYGLE
jgi:integrating conjugative element protein (TIGR03752 family)